VPEIFKQSRVGQFYTVPPLLTGPKNAAYGA